MKYFRAIDFCIPQSIPFILPCYFQSHRCLTNHQGFPLTEGCSLEQAQTAAYIRCHSFSHWYQR